MPSRLIAAVALVACAGMPAPQNKAVADVSFEPAFRGIAFVAGSINHRPPLNMLLDTGAGASSVNRHKAEALGLAMAPGRASAAGDLSLKVGVIRQATIGIGKAEVTTQVAAVPLDDLEQVFGRSIDVIAGGDLLAKYIAEFDYQRGRIAFFSPENYRRDGQDESLPITVYEGIPFTELTVRLPNKHVVRGKFLIDTGAGTVALQIYKGIAEKNGWLTSLAIVPETARGIGGTTHNQAARAASVEFGRYQLTRPPVAFTDDYDPQHTLPGAVGLVGIEILRRFRLTFNYAAKRLYLTPNNEIHKPFVYDASGLGLRSPTPQFQEKIVTRVLEGSAAAEAGFQTGDNILAMDGVRAESMKLDELRAVVYAPGRSHNIHVRRGNQILNLVLNTRDLLP